MKRSNSSAAATQSAIDPLVRLWILRILVPLGAHKEFIRGHGFANDGLAEQLGFAHWLDPDVVAFMPGSVLKELRRQHQQAESEQAQAVMPEVLAHNLALLAELLGLSEVDQKLLGFAVMLHNDRLLDDVADWLGHLASGKAVQMLSVLLGLPETDLRDSLSPKGLLARAGLLSLDRNCVCTLRGKLDLLSSSFGDRLLWVPFEDPTDALLGAVQTAPEAGLNLKDFDHLQEPLRVLTAYLRAALQTRRMGVNICFYGPPGTGKTQLARALAQVLACPLFEVASEDAEGEPLAGVHRLRAFRAAQSFFAKRTALLVFDEVEDVFNDGDGEFGFGSTAQRRKAWINRILETNAIPTMWLTNSLEGLDSAFLRRFDFVLEVPIAPVTHRERMFASHVGDWLPGPALKRLAQCEDLAPAVVARAASVVRVAGQEFSVQEQERALFGLVSNTLVAQGHRPPKLAAIEPMAHLYDPRWLSADHNVVELAQGLKRHPVARLCLFGPPGTGKSAYVQWLAQELGRPVMARRASDLLSRWVGGSEQRLAAAFAQAEQSQAILLIDEIDGLLQQRAGAQQGWELSLVNELLSQLEAYRGIFVATTNRMEHLDGAAFRRFDLKVRFDYLKPQAAQELLRRVCEQEGWPSPNALELARLARLNTLAPGDFAAVLRQHRFAPLRHAAALIDALCADQAFTGQKQAVGFI